MFGIEDSYFLPVGMPIVVLSIVAAAILLWRRQRNNRIPREDFYSEFLPPMLGPNVPKEQTYIVPRNWKPHSNGVYSPLSVPLQDMKSSRISVIHALSPSHESLVKNHAEFV